MIEANPLFDSRDSKCYWPSQSIPSRVETIPNENTQTLENSELTHLNDSPIEVYLKEIFKTVEGLGSQNHKAYQLVEAAKTFIFNRSSDGEFLQYPHIKSEAELTTRSGLPLCKPGDNSLHILLRLDEIFKNELTRCSADHQKLRLLKEYRSFQNGLIDLISRKLNQKPPQIISWYLNHKNQDNLSFKELHNQSLLKMIAPDCTKYDMLTTLIMLFKFFSLNENEFIHKVQACAQELAFFKFIFDFFENAFPPVKKGDSIISFISHAMVFKEKSSETRAESENALRENLKKFISLLKDTPDYEDMLTHSLMINARQLNGTTVMAECIQKIFVPQHPCSKEEYKALAKRCMYLQATHSYAMKLNVEWTLNQRTVSSEEKINFFPGENVIEALSSILDRRQSNLSTNPAKAFFRRCIPLAEALAEIPNCPFQKKAAEFAETYRKLCKLKGDPNKFLLTTRSSSSVTGPSPHVLSPVSQEIQNIESAHSLFCQLTNSREQFKLNPIIIERYLTLKEDCEETSGKISYVKGEMVPQFLKRILEQPIDPIIKENLHHNLSYLLSGVCAKESPKAIAFSKQLIEAIFSHFRFLAFNQPTSNLSPFCEIMRIGFGNKKVMLLSLKQFFQQLHMAGPGVIAFDSPLVAHFFHLIRLSTSDVQQRQTLCQFAKDIFSGLGEQNRINLVHNMSNLIKAAYRLKDSSGVAHAFLQEAKDLWLPFIREYHVAHVINSQHSTSSALTATVSQSSEATMPKKRKERDRPKENPRLTQKIKLEPTGSNGSFPLSMPPLVEKENID